MENTVSTASLKKLKREAAQRRKAQARSLKLRAEEQERLQRLEIDALVEQQRLQRLERQRCEEDAARLAQEAAVNTVIPHSQSDGIKPCKGGSGKQQLLDDRSCMDDQSKKANKDGAAAGSSWRPGKEAQRAKQAQQQSMRAAVESRRRLARGPRSGVLPDAHVIGAGSMLPSEDHRVVSTEYQAAGTQALMRVTLLAAGFVIGARGISARLIGQVTGAIVQSWTESCRPDSVPIRLFRIQGKKVVVQAAVHLIEQAVAKYKDLCECKRRGEFVQREHIINGVEFYYQPPPRKAFATPGTDQPGPGGSCCTGKVVPGGDQAAAAAHGGQACNAQSGAPPQLPFAPHHAWLQHLQQQHQAQAAAAAQHHKQAQAAAMHEANQVHDAHGQNHRSMGRPQHGFFDWQAQQTQVDQQQQQSADQAERDDVAAQCAAASELELIDQGLQQSVASLEQALQQVRLEQRLLQHNRGVADSSAAERNNKQNCENSLWSENAASYERGPASTPGSLIQLGSSLFSIFGNGGLPLPITQDGPSGLADPSTVGTLSSSTAVSTTPFDFPACDFLRESLPAFPFAATLPCRDGSGLQVPAEYSLYGSPVNKIESINDSSCIVCLEQPAGVRLMTCGHASFCLPCVQGLVNCPLCREKIVGLHQIGAAAAAPPPASPAAAPGASSRAGSAPAASPVGAKLNGSSSYHLWNWVPGASV